MIRTKEYDINRLGSHEQEWLLHKGCRDWWYATGYFSDEAGSKYSYQFTILNIQLGPVCPVIAMTALTDFQTRRHCYRQRANLSKKYLSVTENSVVHGDSAYCEKRADGMRIRTNHRDFSLDLWLDYGKGAFWHCDGGRLQMGRGGDKETTYYYSYTNMPTRGSMTLDGKTISVKGKSWFDKQGGSYTLGKISSWEWMSLRFYDDEEMMLFKFPATGYHDGTYIDKNGLRERLNNYELTTTKFVEAEGSVWSAGWDLTVPGKKDEHYTVTPLMDGCINLAYFEELCGVYNDRGEEVGMCFVELLPHMYDDKRMNLLNLLKSFEK